MRLSVWIAASGGRRVVARRLKVTPEAIHYWLSGKSTPEFKTILKIVSLSKGRVSISDILDETKARERAGVSK